VGTSHQSSAPAAQPSPAIPTTPPLSLLRRRARERPWLGGLVFLGTFYIAALPTTYTLFSHELASVAGTLTPRQRERYGHLTMVGAQIIIDEKNRPIGVLGVACEDGSPFTADAVQIAGSLASDLGILLGDVALATARASATIKL
jgi:hypothetical protein